MSYEKQYKANARKIVKAAIAKGYVVSVCDGEEWTVKKSTDVAAIINALCTTDEDILRFRNADGAIVGSVFLVYGNLPEEVVADHSDNPETKALVAAAGL